jgi:hypothetical protein
VDSITRRDAARPRYVHSVSKDVVGLGNHIAEIDADAELDALIRRGRYISFDHPPLPSTAQRTASTTLVYSHTAEMPANHDASRRPRGDRRRLVRAGVQKPFRKLQSSVVSILEEAYVYQGLRRVSSGRQVQVRPDEWNNRNLDQGEATGKSFGANAHVEFFCRRAQNGSSYPFL